MIVILVLFIIVIILYISLFIVKPINNRYNNYFLLLIGEEALGEEMQEEEFLEKDMSESKKFDNNDLCRRYCKEDLCCEYDDLVKDYNSCKKCFKKGLCWDKENKNCIKCKPNSKSCNKYYGCFNKELNKYEKPINPSFNFCKICKNF